MTDWWVTCGSYAMLVGAIDDQAAKTIAFQVFFGSAAGEGVQAQDPRWLKRFDDLSVRAATSDDKARVASYEALRRALRPTSAAKPAADAQRLFP